MVIDSDSDLDREIEAEASGFDYATVDTLGILRINDGLDEATKEFAIQLNEMLPPHLRCLTEEDIRESSTILRNQMLEDIDEMYTATKIPYYVAALQYCMLSIEKLRHTLDEGSMPPLEELTEPYELITGVIADIEITYTKGVPGQMEKLKSKWIQQGVSKDFFDNFIVGLPRMMDLTSMLRSSKPALAIANHYLCDVRMMLSDANNAADYQALSEKVISYIGNCVYLCTIFSDMYTSVKKHLILFVDSFVAHIIEKRVDIFYSFIDDYCSGGNPLIKSIEHKD